MTESQLKTKRSLEATMSQVAGFPVELTVRGERAFTVSADGDVDWSKLEAWLKSNKQFGLVTEKSYDAEIDFSCMFLQVL